MWLWWILLMIGFISATIVNSEIRPYVTYAIYAFIGCVVLGSLNLVSGRVVRSEVHLLRRSDAPGIWSRNRDTLFTDTYKVVLGAILGVLGTIAVQKFTGAC